MLRKLQFKPPQQFMTNQIKEEPIEAACIITEEIELAIIKNELEDAISSALINVKNDPEEEISKLAASNFRCDYCHSIFDTAEKLGNHIIAYKHGLFCCKKCNKAFKMHANFKAHQCRYACETCGKTFLRRDNLNQHITYVHGIWSKSQLFTCDHCNKGFKYRKSIICHMKQHMKELPFVCQLCGEGFSVNNTYNQHMLTHGGKVPCKVCGKKLKPSAIYYHMKQTHEQEKNFHCPACPASFKTKGDLNSHIECHEKKYACGQCDRKFSKSYALRQHLLIHENPGVFFCKFCKKNFTRKDCLEQHIEKFHSKQVVMKSEKVDKSEKKKSEEKWIPCQECTQAFLNQNDLKFHYIKVHSKITKCYVCEKNFDSKREVLKHLSLMHNLK